MPPRKKTTPLYIAVGGHAVAIDPATGAELWRTKVKSSSSIMTIMQRDTTLFVGASGELFGLDARTGAILWHNKLKGLGMGLIAFSGHDVGGQLATAQASAATTAAIIAAT